MLRAGTLDARSIHIVTLKCDQYELFGDQASKGETRQQQRHDVEHDVRDDA